jgi:hypothetical protein
MMGQGHRIIQGRGEAEVIGGEHDLAGRPPGKRLGNFSPGDFIV